MCIYYTGTRTESVHIYSHVTRTCNLALSNPCGLLIVGLRHTHRAKSELLVALSLKIHCGIPSHWCNATFVFVCATIFLKKKHCLSSKDSI